jgi:hypothetical protein
MAHKEVRHRRLGPRPGLTISELIDDDAYTTAMHPVRLAILVACSGQPQTLQQLGLPTGPASRHLGELLRTGLVVRDGSAYRAAFDWRPVVAAFEAIVEKGRP